MTIKKRLTTSNVMEAKNIPKAANSDLFIPGLSFENFKKDNSDIVPPEGIMSRLTGKADD